MAINTLNSQGVFKTGTTGTVDLSLATQITLGGTVIGAGLDHIVTSTFSGASTASFNNIFSALYTNYKLLLTVSPSANSTLQMRMRASGTDTVGTNYTYRGTVYGNDSGSNVRTATSGGTVEIATLSMAAGRKTTFTIDFKAPYLAETTTAEYRGAVAYSQSAVAVIDSIGMMHLVDTTLYDGVSFYASTGTLTGRVSVFGYHS